MGGPKQSSIAKLFMLLGARREPLDPSSPDSVESYAIYCFWLWVCDEKTQAEKHALALLKAVDWDMAEPSTQNWFLSCMGLLAQLGNDSWEPFFESVAKKKSSVLRSRLAGNFLETCPADLIEDVDDIEANVLDLAEYVVMEASGNTDAAKALKVTLEKVRKIL